MKSILPKLLGANEPAIVGGLIAAALVAVGFSLTGAFSDGVQAQEWTAIAAPLIAALGIRQAVFAPATVQAANQAKQATAPKKK